MWIGGRSCRESNETRHAVGSADGTWILDYPRRKKCRCKVNGQIKTFPKAVDFSVSPSASFTREFDREGRVFDGGSRECAGRHTGTEAEFCRHHGISPGSLSYWRGKLGTAGFVRIETPDLAPGWDVEFELGGGMVLRLRRPGC